MARKQPAEDRSTEHRLAGADATDQPGNARHSAKPFPLLDTRVIYCGDWHASHFVKVMLNQRT